MDGLILVVLVGGLCLGLVLLFECLDVDWVEKVYLLLLQL